MVEIESSARPLSDDGNEIHPCRSASREVRCQFALDADPQGVARGGGGLSHGLLLEWGDNVDVQGGRTTTAPGGEEDISWSGEGVGIIAQFTYALREVKNTIWHSFFSRPKSSDARLHALVC